MCAEYQNVIVSSSDVSNEVISTNKMLRALSSIAFEMQKFHSVTPISFHNFGVEPELCDKLCLCKSNLRLKKKQIKLLKDNLRKACIVAKTVMAAKENETISLHNHINSARSECADWVQKNKTSAETIQYLSVENRLLKNKFMDLEKLITLSYQELQKIRDLPKETIPVIMQLKEIILCCGQYYADYSNEHDARIRIEQKNRFLNNKINIIGNNLQGMIEELKNLRYQNVKLQKENSLLKNKYFKQIENSPADITSGKNNIIHVNKLNYASMHSLTAHNFDLSAHLSLVKNLLDNQDDMLKDLKKLSETLIIHS